MKGNKHVYHLLSKASYHKRRRLLTVAENNIIKAIAEAAYNLLYGTVPLTRTKLQQFSRYKQILRHLVLRSNSLFRKRALLQTRRGSSVLTLLLPILIRHDSEKG